VLIADSFDGSAAQTAIIIAAVGTVILQVLGRLQAWQLAVIAARTEAKSDAGQKATQAELNKVHSLVNSTTSHLLNDLKAISAANTALREQVSGFVERDAVTAQLAREAALKGVAPVAIAGAVLSASPPSSG
jgi:hypothetical protein